MSQTTIMVLSLLGIAIGGADGYWQIHSADPITMKFWIGLAFGTLAPVGTYLVGLAQKAPWETPKA